MMEEKFKPPVYKKDLPTASLINDHWILDTCDIIKQYLQRFLILEWNFRMPTFHLVMYCNYLATNTNTEFIHIVEYTASRKKKRWFI